MSDFTILMDSSKFLTVTSKNVNLFQGDNYIDSFSVLIPATFGDIDLTPFTATLQYVDENQNAYVDILEPETELYKENYIRYRLPITTQITRSAGHIKMQLSLNYVDKEKLIQYSLHSSEITIYIHPVSDYYRFSDDSLSKIDKRIGELAEKADYLAEMAEITVNKVPDDLGFDEDGTLHISARNVLLGQGVNVAVPGTEDTDPNPDGVLDADEIYSSVEL